MHKKNKMRYPDTLKLYFIYPKRKVSKARIIQLERILKNFNGIIITHSHHYGSGIEYNLQEVNRWNTGEIIFNLNRKDDEVIPDNLKKL